MDSTVYNPKLLDLLDDNNTYKLIRPKTNLKSVNSFIKSYKKFVSKEDKFFVN